jgi:hypothetical protein
MKIKRTILLLCLFLLTKGIEAQSIINGTVVNSKGTFLSDVSVVPEGAGSTITQKDGTFEIIFPSDSSSIAIHFSCLGYKPKKVKLYKSEKNVQILLSETATEMNEIVVTSPKYSRFSNYAAQIIKLNRFEVYTNPQALGDVIGSLQIMPGVQRNDNNGRLIVQGGATDETQTFVDGLLLFNQYNLEQKNVSVRSRFSPDLFNGVSLQSSGYGAQYGNALSGILQLNTIAGEDMDEKMDINVSSVSVESSLIHKTKNTSLRGNVAYMNLTPYGSLIKDNYTWHKYFNQFSSDLFMANHFNSGAEIKTHVFYSKSGVDYSYANVDNKFINNNLLENNFLSSIVADIPISNNSSLYAGANIAYNNFSGTDVSIITDSVNDVKINSHHKLAFLFRKNTVTNSFGVENVYSKLSESYHLNSLYKLKFENNQLAIYDDISLLINKFNANIGLRGEYSTLIKEYALSPRIYMAYKFSAENIVSLSMGRYFQLPNEKYLKFSNKIGYNDAYSTTISYSYANKLSKLQIDMFWKKYNHLTTFDLENFYYTNIANGGKGNTKGINVFWKSNTKYFEYWLTYGFLDADIINENFTKYHTPSYLSNHTFNATLKYWIKDIKTMLGSSFFVDAGSTSYKESNLELFKKTPYRNRVDISLSYVPTSSIIIHFSCQNILGRNNIYGYEYSSTGDTYRAITNPTTRFYYIGIFVTLSKNNINQLKKL